MRRAMIFFDAFLDGFTMAGFMGRLERPGAVKRLFARPLSAVVQPVERALPTSPGEEPDLFLQLRSYLAHRGNDVPDPVIDRELREMLVRLGEADNVSAHPPHEGAVHAGTR